MPILGRCQVRLSVLGYMVLHNEQNSLLAKHTHKLIIIAFASSSSHDM